MAEIIPIETPSLGDRSYVVSDGSNAVVVDPQRDIDRVLTVVEERGLEVVAVAETHLHNDYVTGGLELARRFRADYLVAADDDVAFSRRGVRDGDAIELGNLVLHVRATPGHTEHHLSYLLEAGGEIAAVFSGGSLLYGATGRTDLVRPDLTEALTRAQYASAHRLAGAVPASTALFPTHGFGSFCSAGGSADRKSSTLQLEQTDNPVFLRAEDEFVAETLAGLDAYPAYYDHMGPVNAAGPVRVDLSRAPRADAAEISRRIGSGEWVVDLRAPAEFAARHVAGTLCFGLDGSFATYLGWLMPWGAPVTLLGTDDAQVAEAQRELVRIGLDRPAAVAVGGPDVWAGDRPVGSFGTATFDDLREAMGRPEVVVLDVRADSEWEESHVQDAVHIPIHEVPARVGEVPPGEAWVHCATGYRATIAASLLAREGRSVVTVVDDYEKAGSVGVPLERAAKRFSRA